MKKVKAFLLAALVLLLILAVVANISLERKNDKLTYQVFVNYKLAIETISNNLRISIDPNSSHKEQIAAAYWISNASIHFDQIGRFGLRVLSSYSEPDLAKGLYDYHQLYYDWWWRVSWAIITDELTPDLIEEINCLISTMETLSPKIDKILDLGERGISKRIQRGNSEFHAVMAEIYAILQEEDCWE
jgi:hypothetical protein